MSQTQIAACLGASQAQISRILRGHNLRPSRLFEEVCLLAERQSLGVTAEAVCQNEELIEALRETWDGTAVHARALATVIRSLSALSSPLPSSSSSVLPPKNRKE
ncbi:hypothetical protein ACFONG_15115 [Uliginosibacterium paludis]|uniref:HTH cro/C1-type domain-containing protein n=1 Tax=Uliginosibacterium paludis TaxID=1615952 RepID=A0ABV2CTH5_9RHOO